MNVRHALSRFIAYLKSVLLDPQISLYLAFGLALSVLSLALFWNVTENVVEGDTIVMVDTALANQLHAQATPLGTSAYIVISWLGSEGLVALGVGASLWFIARRQWFHLTFWLIALAGGFLLNTLIKQLIGRPRPVFTDPLVLALSYSFPSGHSMASLIAYGMVAYFLWFALPNRRARIVLVFAAVLLIILIGISRMALGVHYLSDVVGGFAAGGIWLGMCIAAMNLWKRRRRA
jgi:undecaprenyl-diphosphatase